MTQSSSDEPVARLLRRSMADRDATEGEVCPDVELLAAFIERSLDREEMPQVERHVSSCARCAQVLAVSLAAEPAPGTGQPRPVPFWRSWRWAVPMATAATVAGLWVATTGPQIERASTSAVERPAAPPATATQESADAALSAPAGQPTAPRGPETTLSSEAPQRESRAVAPRAQEGAVQEQAGRSEDAARSEPSALGQDTIAAAPGAADAASPRISAEEAGAAGQVERRVVDRLSMASAPPAIVPSPSPDVLWRARGTVVERSMDTGATWQAEYTADRPVLGGSAASRDVAWFHGASALILRRTPAGWSEVPPPESGVEIASVQSVSADTATVTLVDGRQFRTDNRGQTWTAP